jgi:cytochrome c551/c552
MKRLNVVLFALLVLTFGACNDHPYTTVSHSEQEVVLIPDSLSPAMLFEQRCQSCHQPPGNHESRLAPPIHAIQNHYSKKYPQEEDFVQAIVKFATDPHQDKVMMKGASERFGVMPEQAFDSLEVEQIARYIYHLPRKEGKGHQRGKQHQKQKRG